ncbi:hypothetical protein J2X65_003187 [Ancylobacter sp. 3268]|uniref:hypothetical protein n=1 Tax=Ancylobacter sp. 3268 TaxID=2817752 RepID=UPI002859A2CC|nr:hypothetical protein [Ancylobacter sp. 3268]MDR6953824.1 hypothetical protein [Ancylobacter sp. 3268]
MPARPEIIQATVSHGPDGRLIIDSDGKAEFVAPNGIRFYIALDGNDLWVHVSAPEGWSPKPVEFEHNAGNEGWLKTGLRLPVPATPLPLRARAA